MRPSEHPVKRTFAAAMERAPIGDAVRTATAVFVGYSGGADSAVLLTLMQAYCEKHALPCTAIHVHHGIRGAEADRDADACRQFCRERSIPLICRHADAPAYAAEHHMGMEEAARCIRYGIFEEILAAHPGAVLATAHSADDQLETVLHHLLRGSGIDGLCGIPPVRGAVIRPLLTVSAADIRDFCRAEQIPFVEDSTNTDDAYTRNYIRSEIVPRLRRITPSPEAAAVRMSELLREDAAYLDSAAEDALGDYAGASIAPVSCLQNLPDALLSRAVIRLYKNEAGAAENLSSVQIRAVLALVRRGGSGQVSLPGGRAARLQYGMLDFREEISCPIPPEDFEVPLHMGDNLFAEFGFGIRIREYDRDPPREDPPENINIYKLFIWNSFPSAIIQNELFLRFRRPGDTVRMGGMTRQVRKLFNQQSVPPEERNRRPVICDSKGILWIPGICARDSEVNGGKTVVFSYFTL